MPATYRIDRDRRCVYSTASGVVTEEDFFNHQRLLEADPDFQADFGQLCDTRGISELRLTSDGVRRLASRSPFGKGSRRCVVADRDDTFGLARMFEMLRQGRGDEVCVVRTLPEALSWLGLCDESG